VLQWPLAFVLLGEVLAPYAGGAAPAVLYLSRAPGVVLFSAVVFSVMVMAGAAAPGVPAIFLLLLAGFFVWHLNAIPWRARRALGGLIFLASLLPGGVAVGSSRFGPESPRTDTVMYAVDADHSRAFWLSPDRQVDELVAQYVPATALVARMPRFSVSGSAFRIARAPWAAEPLGKVDVRSDPTEGDERSVTLQLHPPPRPPRCLEIWQETGAAIHDVTVNDEPIQDFWRFSPELDERLLRLVAGSHGPRVFRMEACGLSDAEVALSFRAAGHVRLRVVEVLDGLPKVEGKGHIRRGASFLPAEKSDVTRISRGLDL
jgi:hypothetical protein